MGASLEANPRAAELISSAGWVADVDDSGSDDEEDSPASANNPSSSSSSSALPAKFSKKSGWGVPTPTPAASKTEELSKSQFPTLAAAKAVAEAQAEAGGEDGFNVVGSRRARRGPASMSSSGSGGGRSY